MVDFIKFVKEHPGIDLKVEYWHDHPRGIVITMTKYPPIRRFRFCVQDELLSVNPYNLDVDTYIEMWLNNGLKELNKEEKMIKIENVSTTGWEPAIRGARNPMNSWEKSDSLFANESCDTLDDLFGETVFEPEDEYSSYYYNGVSDKKKQFSWAMDFNEKVALERWPDEFVPAIGPNDLKLLSNLAKAGSDEAKFRRMIVVYVDVTAPMYWWKEADTYKVGTVRNSCSTMHKIHAKEFVPEDFSIDRLALGPENVMYATIHDLNELRNLYLELKDKDVWYQMIQLLPSAYNQRATLMLNYEVLANIYHARKNHKLDEWREFCKWIETLPYAKELIIGEERDTEAQLRARFASYEKRIRFLEGMMCKELHKAYDMSIKDISERLSIAESTVKYFVDGGE